MSLLRRRRPPASVQCGSCVITMTGLWLVLLVNLGVTVQGTFMFVSCVRVLALCLSVTPINLWTIAPEMWEFSQIAPQFTTSMPGEGRKHKYHIII